MRGVAPLADVPRGVCKPTGDELTEPTRSRFAPSLAGGAVGS